MGVVYEAHDPALERTLALKTILLAFSVTPEERAAFEQRFFAEARIAARLRHPGIVVVHDVGRDEATDLLFIAFEHLAGRTLLELVKQRPLAWREALRIARDAARALQHAHAAGVVHRDIKPANIMLLEGGEVKVMDFGIAKVPTSQLTAAGQVFGTPANMSPEQAHGAEVDARSDLFSLGTVLYQLLTGRRAFDGGTLPQILEQVLHGNPPPPSHVVADVPAEADAVVARLLAKRPADRYPSAAALADHLDVLLSPPAAVTWAPAPVETAAASAFEVVEPTAELAAPVSEPVPSAEPGAAPARAPAATRRPRVERFAAVAGLAFLALAVVLLWLWRQPGESSMLELLPFVEPPAHLVIDFEHPLRTGSLKVWLDDEAVVEADLSGRVTTNILGLKLRKGTLGQMLDVKPGRHLVRVQVAWDDNVREQRSERGFESGQLRQLQIRLGRLRKDLSLEWK